MSLLHSIPVPYPATQTPPIQDEPKFSPSYNRKRKVSLMSVSSVRSRITIEFPKAEPVLALGHTRAHLIYGSFIPTPSARASLEHLNRISTQAHSIFDKFSRRPTPPSQPWEDDRADSPLSSGTSSPTIPSFSRMTSPYPISSSSPTSPETKGSLVARRPRNAKKQNLDFDPILAKVERKSKLLGRKVVCATCGQVGSDYPKCGRCDAMWCSRECRMYGGKRHTCPARTPKNKAIA